jgi:archaeosortase A (PGF-CTERM-specific)
MLMSPSTATLLGVIGMALLAISWFWRNKSTTRIAQVGWVFVGLYFFNDSFRYLEHDDVVLVIMSALTLPMALAMAWWEGQETSEETRKALNWARGAVAFAGGPYLLIAHMPWLNVLAIWVVASQSAWMLRFSGGQDIQLGETWVNTDAGVVTWDAWEGNRWFSAEMIGEYPIHTELILADGSMIGINFVLACTALQSLVVFIGAISVLDIDWKRRLRALFLVVAIIHILNLFRNAGLIWMHLTYATWEFNGLSVFDFGHAYVARVVSLFAMFLMALIMFDILPELHKHILRLLKPLTARNSKSDSK